jgi:hypothetical protein
MTFIDLAKFVGHHAAQPGTDHARHAQAKAAISDL